MDTFAVSPASTSATEVRSRNYFLRHWRGELSLGISYWVNGAILGNILPALFLAQVATGQGSDLRLAAALTLFGLAMSMLVWTWGTVGIWRSADRHKERGGSGGWAIVAKFMVVLGMLATFANLASHNVVRQVIELSRMVAGKDDIQKIDVAVAPDGRSILLSGTFGLGSAEAVSRVLDKAPNVTTVELNSIGGRIGEAKTIASMIRSKNLSTYVEGGCASACTIVFLSGKDRGATPNARIGFHRAAFAGQDAAANGPDDQMIAVYRAAGISAKFIDRVRSTDSASAWFPSREELLANGVMTRISTGGETALVSGQLKSAGELRVLMLNNPLWAAVEARYPGAILRAAEAMWAAQQTGAKGEVVLSAGRAVISELTPKAMATAPVSLLEKFLELMVSELTAARALSPEACGKFLDGRLDISATLPGPVVEKDKAFMQELFSAAKESGIPPSAKAVQSAIAHVLSGLSPADLDVVRAQETYADRPRLRCDAFIAYYRGVAGLPTAERRVALKGMFQSGK